MSNLAAAVVRPQIMTFAERTEKYNGRYWKLVEEIEARAGEHISIPVGTPGMTTAVHDSFQFKLHPKFTPEKIEKFLV